MQRLSNAAGLSPRAASVLDVAGAYNTEIFSEGRTKAGKRTSQIVDPLDGRIPLLTEAGLKRAVFRQQVAGCLNVSRREWVRAGRAVSPVVAIYYEHGQGGGASRIIPVDGSEHLPPSIRNYLGDSRGHWEGDTLVVDVTRQIDKTWFDRPGNFHSDALHVIERLSPFAPINITCSGSRDSRRPWLAFLKSSNATITSGIIA